jgi:Na+-driven multidrug efflux pump
MVIGGTLVVFDSMFVSMGFGPWAPFTFTGELNMSANAYASLGAAGISSVQPYFLLISATGVLVGAGSAMKMSKAKARGDDAAYQKAMNSFLPQNVF